jgi:hypothetical protein
MFRSQSTHGNATYDAKELRTIASRQRAIIVCVVLYLVVLVLRLAVPADSQIYVNVAVIVLGIVALVFVFDLAKLLYGTDTGAMFGIATVIPVIGLLSLLIVNQKATKVLNSHGIRVGIFGARDPISGP